MVSILLLLNEVLYAADDHYRKCVNFSMNEHFNIAIPFNYSKIHTPQGVLHLYYREV